MPWQDYESKSSNYRDDDPILAVYGDGDGRLNVEALQRWFDPGQKVTLHFDPETASLGIDAEASGPSPITVSQGKNESGGDLALRGALKDFGLEIEAHDETQRFELEHDDASGFVVADISALPGISQEFSCDEPDCNYTSTSERGLNIHKARIHGDDGSEGGEEIDDEGGDQDAPTDEQATGGGGDVVVLERILEDYDDPIGLAADLDGVATYHDVQRALNLPNRTGAVALAGELGWGDRLNGGSVGEEITTNEARQAIEEAIGDA